jgi:hypothetical protein
MARNKLEVDTSRKELRRRRDDDERQATGDSFVGEDTQFIGFLLLESAVVAAHTLCFILIQFIVWQVNLWDKYWFTSTLTMPVRWLLGILLGDIKSFRYPALSLSPPWMLLFLQKMTNIMPNLAYRISQQQMGLLTLKELMGVATTHLLTSTMIFGWIYRFVSSETYSHILPVIQYKDECSSISVVTHEALLTFTFVVGMRVIPVLLTINHIPVQWTSVIMYPLYCHASVGINSTLHPIFLLSQAFRGENVESCHLIGQILGAIAAGRFMNRYAPEETMMHKRSSKCFI